ncbi:hypothetical protein D3C80_2084070 [compost metagenome]
MSTEHHLFRRAERINLLFPLEERFELFFKAEAIDIHRDVVLVGKRIGQTYSTRRVGGRNHIGR